MIERWHTSWAREHPRAPRRRAAALETSALERMVKAAAERPRGAAAAAHALQYTRDRALMLIGIGAALRGAELVALELAHIEQRARGLLVFVARSKTDQEGKGEWIAVLPQGREAVCPVHAFEQWLHVRGAAPGPLFVGVSRAGQLELERLSERHVTRLVTGYARRAGLELQVSAHSMRATLASLADERGRSLGAIMAHGRWKSPDVATRYMQGRLFRDNVTAGLLE